MVDAPQVLLTHLNTLTRVTTLTSTRIWAETDTPPPGYTPADGAAICFRRRGGDADVTQEGGVLRDSYQFKIYGPTPLAANAAYRALFDGLHLGGGVGLISAALEAAGQTLREPETDWPFVLTFFECFFINEE